MSHVTSMNESRPTYKRHIQAMITQGASLPIFVLKGVQGRAMQEVWQMMGAVVAGRVEVTVGGVEVRVQGRG